MRESGNKIGRILRRFSFIFSMSVLLLSGLHVSAGEEETLEPLGEEKGISYMDVELLADDVCRPVKKSARSYIYASEDDISWGEGESNWIVVYGTKTFDQRINVYQDVNLILLDGAVLNATKGITVVAEHRLNIYGQENGTGVLNAQGEQDNAGIGSAHFSWGKVDCGTIRIYGGTINAKGGSFAAGIGGNSEAGGGSISIYGGTVTAEGGGHSAPGIGSGAYAHKSSIEIYGGHVTGIGDEKAPGIGTGIKESPDKDKRVIGKDMVLRGGDAPDPVETIDLNERKRYMTVFPIKLSYQRGSYSDSEGKVTFTEEFIEPLNAVYATENAVLDDGTDVIKWTNKNGPYILRWDVNAEYPFLVEGQVELVLCDEVSLTANKGIIIPQGACLTVYTQEQGTGEIIAKGTEKCAGIGGGNEYADGGSIKVFSGSLLARGGAGAAGIGGGEGGSMESVKIYGGTVSSKGGTGGAGIGGGRNKDGAAVVVYGGNVSATGGSNAAGVGGGWRGSAESLEVKGGNVTASSGYNQTAIGAGRDADGMGDILISPGLSLLGGTRAGDTELLQDTGARPRYMFIGDVAKYMVASFNEKSGSVSYTEKGTGSFEVINSEKTVWNSGWYVLREDVTIPGRITVNGTVNLILNDGRTLTVQKGIEIPRGCRLNVHTQSGKTGKLIASGEDGKSGIGGGGELWIHSGNITANGGTSGAGIGGDQNGDAGMIGIYGGTITSDGGTGGSGIGGGKDGSSGITYVYGGTVTAKGGKYAAGIGGGEGGTLGNAYLYGGSINAKGGENGSGIGGGKGGNGGKVYLYTGSITAEGGAGGSGIGGGKGGFGGEAYAYAPGVTAKGGSGASGIGCGENGSFQGALFLEKGLAVKDGDEPEAYATVDPDKERPKHMVVVQLPAAYLQYGNGGTYSKEIRTSYQLIDASVLALEDGWYAASGNTYVFERMKVSGEVNLILFDDAVLTAGAGISVPAGSTLNIYAQSEGTGKIIAHGAAGFAAIGGDEDRPNCGNINVYGGNIEASVSSKGTGAGIGGGKNGRGGQITFFSGSTQDGEKAIGQAEAWGGEDSVSIGAGKGSGEHGIITLTGSVAMIVRGGENEVTAHTLESPYAQRYAYMAVIEKPVHVHKFSYSGTTGTGVGTAQCQAEDCELPGRKISFTLLPPKIQVCGDGLLANASLEGIDDFNQVTGLCLTNGEIRYAGTGTTVYEESAVPPVNAGTYAASVSFGGTKTSVNYTIGKGKAELIIPEKSYQKTYGDPAFLLAEASSNTGASLTYAVTDGKDVIALESGEGQIVSILKPGTATITVSAGETEDFAAASDTITVSVGKAKRPDPLPPEKISASNDCEKVGSVSLPQGWEWVEEDFSIPLPEGTEVSARARYCGEDADYYENILATVGITRASHKHAAKKAVKENEILPTCTEGGSYNEVVYCSVCDCEMSREKKTTRPLGHDLEEKEENRIEPSCGEAGHFEAVTTCKRCKQELSRVLTDIPALGHDWEKPEYVWERDLSAVTAKRICRNDETHVETERVNTTVEDIPASDGNDHARKRYTAVFANEAFETQTRDLMIFNSTVKLQYEETTYDGTEKRPKVTVVDGNSILPEGQYTVSYENNVNAGSATVSVTGKPSEDYIISPASATFRINKAQALITDVEAAYGKRYGDPAFILKEGKTNVGIVPGYVITEGKDVISLDPETRVVKILKTGEAKLSLFVNETENYTGASMEIKVFVYKAALPFNAPETEMSVSAELDVVGDAELPDGWEWAEDSREKHISEGETFVAEARYVASDADCFEVTNEKIVVTKANHTHIPGETVIQNRVDGGCEVGASYDEVVICSVAGCGQVLSRTHYSDEPAGHLTRTERENYDAPTCTKDGHYDEVTICNRCMKEIARNQVTVDPLGHDEEAERENVKDHTCTRPGTYDEKVVCKRCEKVLRVSRRITDNAPGHQFGEDGICTVCKALAIDQSNMPAAVENASGSGKFALIGGISIKKLKFPKAAAAQELTLAGDGYNTERVLEFNGNASIKPAQPLTLMDMTIRAKSASGKAQNITIAAAAGGLVLDNLRLEGKKASLQGTKGDLTLTDVSADELIIKGNAKRSLTADGTITASTVTGFNRVTLNGTLTVKKKMTVNELVLGAGGCLILEKGAVLTVKEVFDGKGGSIVLKEGFKPMNLKGLARGQVLLESEKTLEDKQIFSSKLTNLASVFDTEKVLPLTDGYEYGFYTRSGKVFLYPYKLSMGNRTYVFWKDMIADAVKSGGANAVITVSLLDDVNTGQALTLPKKGNYAEMIIDGAGHKLTFVGTSVSLTGKLTFRDITVAASDKKGNGKPWIIKKGSFELIKDGAELVNAQEK